MADVTKRNGAAPEKGWPDWAPDFLKAFEGLGTVRAAAAVSNIAPSTAYRLRDRDPSFAEAWADREEKTTDKMEGEALRRAIEGVEEPVFHNGKKIASIRKFSDVLLIFLLKARRPDVYRERISVDDDREEAKRRRLDRSTEEELDQELTGIGDNVIPIEKGAKT